MGGRLRPHLAEHRDRPCDALVTRERLAAGKLAAGREDDLRVIEIGWTSGAGVVEGSDDAADDLDVVLRHTRGVSRSGQSVNAFHRAVAVDAGEPDNGSP